MLSSMLRCAASLSALLVFALPALAQQPAPDHPAATDVIIRVNGDELPARVLLIGPDSLRYLSLADPARAQDTLVLARQEVFMVRFANGTKEVLTPEPVPSSPGLAGLASLTSTQRFEQGRDDARKHFKPAKGVFWSTCGATFVPYGGFLLGIGVGAAVGTTPPKRAKLLAQAPQPELLDDADYYRGFRQQAQRRKLGKAAAGYGVGTAAQLTIGVVVLIAVLSSLGG